MRRDAMGWVERFTVDRYGHHHYYMIWSWDFWWIRNKHWIKVAQNTGITPIKILKHRFRGNNKGRHWNRGKRR